MSLLSIKNLSIKFKTRRGPISVIRNMSFDVERGETVGLVGESGCGKSVCNLAIMGLLPQDNAIVSADEMVFNGQNLQGMTEEKYRNIRGNMISMIFQDPMSALNPCFTVGFQIEEMLKIHRPTLTKKERIKKCIDLLFKVGIPLPRQKMDYFPHQLSGGMSQRVMIAMAISCNPLLLIADEPTTALDATIQAQILYLLKELQEEHEMAMILITHDLGVVSLNSDKINVMYAGEIVESGSSGQVIKKPLHPYTKGLVGSLPGRKGIPPHTTLPSIPGSVPNLSNRPPGCQFNPRCPYVEERCHLDIPLLKEGNGVVRCIKPIAYGEPPQ